MKLRVFWTRQALKDLGTLERTAQLHVRQAIYRLAETGYGDVAKVQAAGRPIFRLRVRAWRVFFAYEIGGTERHLVVLRILHRRDAYR